MSLFKLAYEALICNNVEKKILLIGDLKKHQIPFDIKKSKVNVIKIPSPGRPLKPHLVDFKGAPKRDRSDLGMIKNIHAICHIEFNSINLALDAIYRFQEMPHQYYSDWIRVANEETTHFLLIKDYLESIGHSYGDFDAHNGLWQMTVDTDYDVLSRMALVPRVLEARGLDVTPRIRKKFKDANLHKMVEILDIIFKDEIGHVKIGNYWYQYLCNKRDLDPIKTFDLLIKKHIGSNLRGPFNIEARLLSNFSHNELNYLEHPELLKTN
ncbi:ferritin-like domain-containing protein [Candidatus Thioglobus sp.]|nr:ferritin-like domain-containing protein [Candidatus Thioglobus sp.]